MRPLCNDEVTFVLHFLFSPFLYEDEELTLLSFLSCPSPVRQRRAHLSLFLILPFSLTSFTLIFHDTDYNISRKTMPFTPNCNILLTRKSLSSMRFPDVHTKCCENPKNRQSASPRITLHSLPHKNIFKSMSHLHVTDPPKKKNNGGQRCCRHCMLYLTTTA
jgi:hypothetical protein